MQELRPYQGAAIEAVRRAWDAGNRAPLIALATGGGKTTIIAELLRQTVQPARHRALVIAHTQEIVFQAFDRIRNQYGDVLDRTFNTARSMFASGIGIVMGEHDAMDARIVVATRQSLHTKRIKQVLEYGAFDVVIIDECHHATGENTYSDIVDACRAANPNVNLLGVTATPKRSDGAALKTVFEDVAYDWPIIEGIKGGYLVPPTRVKVNTRVDTSGVKTTSGDYASSTLVSLLDMNNWRELAVAAYMKHIAPMRRPTLAFMPSVEMSREFVVALREADVRAEHIDGETDKARRQAILMAYAQGDIDVISNYSVLTEGFDAPRTSAILMARPTRSKTLLTQIIGRGLRPFAGKKDCLIVDLTVLDTKVLTVSDIMGKMRECESCRAEFFLGLRACPHCGKEVVKTKREILEDGRAGQQLIGADTALYAGKELVTTYESMFSVSVGAWHWDERGYMSLGLGHEGTLVIIPPLLTNDFVLTCVPNRQTDPIQVICRHEDLPAVIAQADQYMLDPVRASRVQAIASKEAYWRDQPASTAQLGLLSKLSPSKTAPMGMTKGHVSKLISHIISVNRIIEEAARRG